MLTCLPLAADEVEPSSPHSPVVRSRPAPGAQEVLEGVTRRPDPFSVASPPPELDEQEQELLVRLVRAYRQASLAADASPAASDVAALHAAAALHRDRPAPSSLLAGGSTSSGSTATPSWGTPAALNHRPRLQEDTSSSSSGTQPVYERLEDWGDSEPWD